VGSVCCGFACSDGSKNEMRHHRDSFSPLCHWRVPTQLAVFAISSRLLTIRMKAVVTKRITSGSKMTTMSPRHFNSRLVCFCFAIQTVASQSLAHDGLHRIISFSRKDTSSPSTREYVRGVCIFCDPFLFIL